MIQRVLSSKNFIAVVLAMVTGTVLYFKMSWPMTTLLVPQTWNEYFLRLIALRDPWTYAGLKASYQVMLFTTPYIGYSFLLSALYIFTLRPRRAGKPQALPPYPAVETRNRLSLVLGEVHNPRLPIPAEKPSWLVIPERGLFTGTIIIGAVGSGKTSCCIYPFTDQLLGYHAADPEAKPSGLVLEVKGDFCNQVKEILAQRGRVGDYIEISIDSEWAYNPLHNDLDGYALAYGIASLLNNLFGKGKEPFWQQAYTNLIKFIIILHQVGFGYVTLFDIYESAISPEVFEKKRCGKRRRISSGDPFLGCHGRHSSLMHMSLPKWASMQMKRANSTAYLIPRRRGRSCRSSGSSPPLSRNPFKALLTRIERNNSIPSSAGTTATGRTLTRNCKARLSKVFRFFCHCLTTIPV